jgi:hypothetical protein
VGFVVKGNIAVVVVMLFVTVKRTEELDGGNVRVIGNSIDLLRFKRNFEFTLSI